MESLIQIESRLSQDTLLEVSELQEVNKWIKIYILILELRQAGNINTFHSQLKYYCHQDVYKYFIIIILL